MNVKIGLMPCNLFNKDPSWQFAQESRKRIGVLELSTTNFITNNPIICSYSYSKTMLMMMIHGSTDILKLQLIHKFYVSIHEKH